MLDKKASLIRAIFEYLKGSGLGHKHLKQEFLPMSRFGYVCTLLSLSHDDYIPSR